MAKKQKPESQVPVTRPQFVLSTNCEIENGKTKQIKIQVLDSNENVLGTWFIVASLDEN
jgi:hypothetical protein